MSEKGIQPPTSTPPAPPTGKETLTVDAQINRIAGAFIRGVGSWDETQDVFEEWLKDEGERTTSLTTAEGFQKIRSQMDRRSDTMRLLTQSLTGTSSVPVEKMAELKKRAKETDRSFSEFYTRGIELLGEQMRQKPDLFYGILSKDKEFVRYLQTEIMPLLGGYSATPASQEEALPAEEQVAESEPTEEFDSQRALTELDTEKGDWEAYFIKHKIAVGEIPEEAEFIRAIGRIRQTLAKYERSKNEEEKERILQTYDRLVSELRDCTQRLNTALNVREQAVKPALEPIPEEEIYAVAPDDLVAPEPTFESELRALHAEYAAKENTQEMRAELTERLSEITNKYANKVKQQDADPEPALPQDSTPAEARKKLSELLAKYGPGKEKDEAWSVSELREARAKEMADRLGITDKRQAMLDLEDAYKQEVAANHGKFFNRKESSVAMAYAEARLAWTTALHDASSQLDGRRRIEAHVIGLRDTVLREEALRQDGKIEGLSERGKTAMGTALRWGAFVPKKIFEGYMWSTGKAGELGAGLYQSMSKKEFSLSEKEQMVAKATKAARIIGSAGMATLLFGGFGGLNAGLSLVVRAARGTLGIAVGAAAGSLAGNLYKETFGEKDRLALRGAKRGVVKTVQDLLRLENAQKRGNRLARERAQKNVELATAFITGAGFSMGTGAAINVITDLEAVQKAAEDLHDAAEKIAAAGGSVKDSAETVQHAASSIEASARAVPAAAAESTAAPSVEATASSQAPVLIDASIEKGQGFNALFSELKGSIGTDHPSMADSSPVAKMLLTLSPTELSDKIGAFDPETGRSMVMQPGDHAYFDGKGNLVFEKLGGKPQIVMVNDPTATGGVRFTPLQDIQMSESSAVSDVVPKGSAVIPTESNGTLDTLQAIKPEDPGVLNTMPLVGELDTSIPDAATAATSVPGTTETLSTLGDLTKDQSVQTAEVSSGATSSSLPNDVQTLGDLARVPQETGIGSVVEGVFTNTHGVEITPSAPAAYDWKIPGTDTHYTYAYGGTTQELHAWVLKELELRPESHILTTETVRDPGTGELVQRVDEWRMGSNGPFKFAEGVDDPSTGRDLRAADPKDFIRKLR